MTGRAGTAVSALAAGRRLGWLEGRHALFVPRAQFALLGYIAVDLGAIFVADGWSADSQRRSWLDVYRRLIPAPVIEWNRNAASGDRPTVNLASYRWSRLPFNEQTLADSSITPVALASALDEELRSQEIDAGRRLRILTEPAELVRAGYRSARFAARAYSASSRQFATGLSMIGIGVSALMNQTRCPNCFRLAAPGFTRCLQHSQSKFNKGETPREHSMRSHAARVARLAARSTTVHEQLQAIPAFHKDAEWATAGILWPLPPFFTRLWDARVATALGAAPSVRALLPSNFDALPRRHQLRTLRAALDPNEWVMPRWPEKIAAAESWLNEAAHVAPGRVRGLTPASQRLVRAADELLRRGLRPTQVAARLGISRSYLSHLRARSRK